jgi:hypothetical protein
MLIETPCCVFAQLPEPQLIVTRYLPDITGDVGSLLPTKTKVVSLVRRLP